jgi:hypothetical protein
MRQKRKIPPALSAIWTPEQEQALEGIRACGFLPVEDAIASLLASIWSNTRSPLQVREANRSLKAAGLPGKAHWLSRRRDIENKLYRAVRTGELQIYAWPAQLDEEGFDIGRAPQNVTVIDPAIIVAVKPLHGGLPTKALGLRPAMIARLASNGVGEYPPPNCLVLFRLAEFHAWAEIERLKGQWPSQLNRRMKLSGRRGRPQRVVERAIVLARRRIDEGEWSTSEPVSRLAEIANHQLSKERVRPISEDTFARAIDRLYRETGEARYKRHRRRGSDRAT